MNGPNEHCRIQKENFRAENEKITKIGDSKEMFWFLLGLFIRLLIFWVRMICRQQRPLYWIQYIPLN